MTKAKVRNVALAVSLACFVVAEARSWWIDRNEGEGDTETRTRKELQSRSLTEAPATLPKLHRVKSLPEDDQAGDETRAAVSSEVTEAELEHARSDMKALTDNFAYNPFSGFDVSAEDYARISRGYQDRESKRQRVFEAEERGEISPEEVGAELEKIDLEFSEKLTAVLGEEKVAMMTEDMKRWGAEEAMPKLVELKEKAEANDP